MRGSRFLLAAALIIGVPVFPAAQQTNDLADIVAGITRAYVARCTPDLTSQGMPPRKAEAVCICVSSALSAEMLADGGSHLRERYDSMMAAQPDPNGSPDDRHLYQIISNCFAH
jgi:hypothetical protein